MTIGIDESLWIAKRNLSEAQVRAALHAARKSLAGAGIDIEEAFTASYKPEAIEFTRERMSKRDWELYEAWWAAAKAAVEATGTRNVDGSWLQMLPAEVGKQSHAESARRLAWGEILEVVPALDPGPVFRFETEAA